MNGFLVLFALAAAFGASSASTTASTLTVSGSGGNSTTSSRRVIGPGSRLFGGPRSRVIGPQSRVLLPRFFTEETTTITRPTTSPTPAPTTGPNCQWMSWETTGRCDKTSPKIYGIRRSRVFIPAMTGGEPCAGPKSDIFPCVERQYAVSTFLETIFSLSRLEDLGNSSTGGLQRREGQDPRGQDPKIFTATRVYRNPCAKTHRAVNNRVRMIGRACRPHRRRRRSAEATVEVDEERTTEARTKREIQSTQNRDIAFILDESWSVKRDFLFILDESGSVGSYNFQKELRMVKAIISKFCGEIRIGENHTRVGITTFDSIQHDHLDFDELFEKSRILAHIDNNVKYSRQSGKATCLVDALKYVKNDVFVDTRGARVDKTGNAGAEQVAILFTDGCANCEDNNKLPKTLKKLRDRFEKQGIPLIVFFIGDTDSCVNLMEGLADGSRCYQVFRAFGWHEFDHMIMDVEEMGCIYNWLIRDKCPS